MEIWVIFLLDITNNAENVHVQVFAWASVFISQLLL